MKVEAGEAKEGGGETGEGEEKEDVEYTPAMSRFLAEHEPFMPSSVKEDEP